MKLIGIFALIMSSIGFSFLISINLFKWQDKRIEKKYSYLMDGKPLPRKFVKNVIKVKRNVEV